jgi:hypothetical protein
MADISQIKLPNNTKYNINVPLVEGTGTTAGTWLGTLDGLTEYYDGLMILYKINIKGASTTTLNLNSLGAKTCYIYGTIKLTTDYTVNSIILLVYSANQNGGCWTCASNYYYTYFNMTASELVTGTATSAKTVRADYLKQGIEEIIGENLLATEIAMSSSDSTSVADKLDELSIALNKVIATIKEVDIKLGDTVWYGVYYGEANIQNWVDTYGTCISAIVVGVPYNRFVCAQLITDATDANAQKVRAYSQQASGTSLLTVRIRLTFIKTYAS